MKLSLLQLLVPAEDDDWAVRSYVFKQMYSEPGPNTQSGRAWARMRLDRPALIQEVQSFRTAVDMVSASVLGDQDSIRQQLRPVLTASLCTANRVKAFLDTHTAGIKRDAAAGRAEEQRILEERREDIRVHLDAVRSELVGSNDDGSFDDLIGHLDKADELIGLY